MPTPQDQYLAHLRTGDAGGYVPKTKKEAIAERDRLMQAGMPREEAVALIRQRVKPANDGPGFFGQLGSNLSDMATGAVDTARQFNGLRALYDPQGLAESYGQAGRGALDTLTRGLTKAKEAWPESKVEAAGRAAAIPFDMLGMPVSRAADHFVAGNTGAGLADTLTAVGTASPRVTGSGLKALATPRATVKRAIAGARTPAAPKPTGVVQPGYLAELDRTMRAPEQARALRMDTARTAGITDDARRLFYEQQHEAAQVARGDAHAARAAEYQSMAPALDNIITGAHKQQALARNAAEVARVGRLRVPEAGATAMAENLRALGPVPREARGTVMAQQELHATIAERNAAELERLGRLRVPEAANTALADNLRSGALTELNQRLQSGSKWQRQQLLPQRESALLQQLTARLSKAVEDMQAAKAAGDPSALQRARAQAEQAQTILRSAEGGMFVR